MAETARLYRIRIRNAADTADSLVLTSVSGGVNPYITDPPSGDGESVDPITGKPTTGAYSVRVADPVTATNTRVVTSMLADVTARQQLIARKAHVETSADGTTWATLVVGYVVAIRLVDAITYEIGIGQSRRNEQSKEIFKESSTRFPATTSIIGGPIFGGFGALVPDNGGWRFYVSQLGTAPSYVQIKLTTGFDPRKNTASPPTTFSSVSTAITDYENNYARPYFEPFATSNTMVTAHNIQGQFPQMRVLLKPISPAYNITTNPNRVFVPLSEPEPSPGSWWTINRLYDNLTRSGVSSLWLPKDCTNADTGAALTFTPAVNDTFDVWVYAVPISENNPLHIFEHPVDLWEKLMLDAEIAYDSTVLAALKTLVGANVKLALRITQTYKLADFLTNVIYGPFRLSTRLVDGKQVLFSIRVRGATPVATITLADLRSDETTVFDLDEQTVVTAVTLKTLKLYKWTTTEKDQPNADSLVSIPGTIQGLENSDDDIPPGLSHEISIGDIPGMILNTNTDSPSTPVPVNFTQFLSDRGDEMFQRFGRGAIGCELACLPSITAALGSLVTLNLPHLPGSRVGQSPVSQRGTPRNFQIVHRTEIPEGSSLKLVDAEVMNAAPVGAGGGSETVTDVTTTTVPTPLAFPFSTGATANWTDSYPQFAVRIVWQAHAPSETVFEDLFDGQTDLLAGTTTHYRASIGIGWKARCRIRYFTTSATSAWSSYSNEVTVDETSPSTPTERPTSLVASSTVTDTAHGVWLNPVDTTDKIRINWQASTEVSSPVVWANVAGGNRLLAANTLSDNQATGAGKFARFRLAYVNASNVAGPYTDWSAYTAITP